MVEQDDFIERVGRFWESFAGSRAAGRILGWLMICEPAHQSATDLHQRLGISTGSVSTQTRRLESLGVVERTTFPGDRSRYYRLPPDVWSKVIHGELDRLKAWRAIADESEHFQPTDRPDRVTDLGVVIDFFLAAWPDLMDRLERHLSEKPT